MSQISPPDPHPPRRRRRPSWPPGCWSCAPTEEAIAAASTPPRNAATGQPRRRRARRQGRRGRQAAPSRPRNAASRRRTRDGESAAGRHGHRPARPPGAAAGRRPPRPRPARGGVAGLPEAGRAGARRPTRSLVLLFWDRGRRRRPRRAPRRCAASTAATARSSSASPPSKKVSRYGRITRGVDVAQSPTPRGRRPQPQGDRRWSATSTRGRSTRPSRDALRNAGGYLTDRLPGRRSTASAPTRGRASCAGAAHRPQRRVRQLVAAPRRGPPPAPTRVRRAQGAEAARRLPPRDRRASNARVPSLPRRRSAPASAQARSRRRARPSLTRFESRAAQAGRDGQGLRHAHGRSSTAVVRLERRPPPDLDSAAWSRERFARAPEHPRGRGLTPAAARRRRRRGACGDLIRIAVRVEGDRVADAGLRGLGLRRGARPPARAAVDARRAARPCSTPRASAPHAIAARARRAVARASCTPPTWPPTRCTARSARPRARRPRSRPDAGRTLVAMSGGVDSAVAALLVARAGASRRGHARAVARPRERRARRRAARRPRSGAARAVAHGMGLPHFTLDLRDEFRAGVVEPVAGRPRARG